MTHTSSPSLKLLVALPLLLASVGCTTAVWREKERTSIITPAMRMAAVREIGARADDADSLEAQQYCEQLTAQIRTEPDPLVRQAIQETIAQFSTPLARDVLLAGLSDDVVDVQLACIRELGKRPEPQVTAALRAQLETSENLDIRLAAVDALGHIKSQESVAALALAVNDRDPALQYAGVEALKAVSGLELGNDVEAWRQYAAGEQPQISVAEKPKEWSFF